MNNHNSNARTENKDNSSPNTGMGDSTPIYLNDDSTLQTPGEKLHDNSVDPRNDDRMDVSNDDLHETRADRMAGSDRAGTAERKDNQVGNRK